MSSSAANPAGPLVRPVMPELDSLRGIAILLVVFFHGFNLPAAMTHMRGVPRLFLISTLGGWTGVNLFFVLSGFLITGILLDSKPKPHYYRRFYVRRALRILPVSYLLLFLLGVLQFTGWLENRRVGWPFLALSFFYLANMVSLFGVTSHYTVLWTLAVEEQFYFLWPTAVRAFSRRNLAWLAFGFCLACPALRALAYRLGNDYSAGYLWLVADSLAMGALLAALSRGKLAGRGPMLAFSLACVIAGFAMLAGLAPLGIWRAITFVGGVFRITAINFVFTGLLGLALVIGTSRWQWIVRRSVLQWFGQISYGLYLFHMLATDFVDHWFTRYFPELYAQLSSRFDLMVARFVLSLAVGVTAAFLSRRYFEERFLKLKDRWAPSASVSQVPVPYVISPEPTRQTA